ncbi:Protein NETWORKED 4B [Linum perenne]
MPDLIAEAEEAYATYDPDTSLPTPDAKLDENHQLAPASSAAANSSELSIKEGSESSPSLSDSDSESSNSSNAYYSLPLNTDRKVLSYQNTGERNPTYEELLRKVDMYEDNLKASNLRLEKSEEEVSWLKNELKSGIETFQSELDSAYRVITVREADLEIERRKVVLLENEIAESMLEVQNQLKFAQEEMETLKAEHSHVRKKQNLLEASITELESLRISLEGKLMQCETEKMEMKTLLDAQEVQSQTEISQLKADLENSGKQIEDLNKNFDRVIAEKDELNAKVDTMTAETAHQQNQIAEKEEHLRLLNLENGKLVEDLRSRVAELENEVERQSGEIVSGAEEKREAIRQLCFALEHYRSCYKELRQAIIGHKRVQIPA